MVIAPILLLTMTTSVAAQNLERPGGDLGRDFPGVQMIRPSLPAWRFNFETNQWERAESLPVIPDAVVTKVIAKKGIRHLRLSPRRSASRRVHRNAARRR